MSTAVSRVQRIGTHTGLLVLSAGVPLSTCYAQSDYVREGIEAGLRGFQGRAGDYFVFIVLACAVLALLRKAPKVAAGCLLLVAGVVVLRIAVSILFGDLAQ